MDKKLVESFRFIKPRRWELKKLAVTKKSAAFEKNMHLARMKRMFKNARRVILHDVNQEDR